MYVVAAVFWCYFLCRTHSSFSFLALCWTILWDKRWERLFSFEFVVCGELFSQNVEAKDSWQQDKGYRMMVYPSETKDKERRLTSILSSYWLFTKRKKSKKEHAAISYESSGSSPSTSSWSRASRSSMAWSSVSSLSVTALGAIFTSNAPLKMYRTERTNENKRKQEWIR